jgi:predicted phage-related endonuclease
MITRIDTAPGSPLRDYYVGASEVPGILGLSPYADQTPRAIWRRKRGLDPDTPASVHTRIGHALEPVILDALRAELPALAVLHKPDLSYVSSACPRLAAAPDGADDLDAPGALAECKAWGNLWRDADALDQLRTGIVPDSGRVLCAYVQVQAQLLATGAAVAYLGWLDDSRRIQYAEIRPDAAWHRVIIAAVANFADLLDRDIEPGASAGDRDALLREPPTLPDPPAALDHLADQLDELAALKDSIARAEQRRAEIEAAIAEALGEHARGVGGVWKVSRSVQTRSALDQRALREAHPDIADQFTRTGQPFGVLRITRSKA